ncbi:MAG: 30S ribosomal protein S16 [Patescibacteria group bacterium]
MLRIRLQRVGRKHEPSFRVVLTESQNSTKSGRVQEILGTYDPRFDNPVIKGDRVKYWISMGAQPTDTVHNLLVSQKILEGKKKNVLPKKSLPPKDGSAQAVKAKEEKSIEAVAEVSGEEVLASENTEEVLVAEISAEEKKN